jgi:uncharacterized protein YecE (DUF72 family)
VALRIGTSGWNYPTGKGSWNGIFYPLPEDRERGFDELRFYAERFNTVEVNSTFYGQPRANAALGWAKRTPPDFEFTVKMYQKFTHPEMSVEPGPVTQADVDAFKGGIDPLAAAGKLGPLLVQFPASFQRTQEAIDYLGWLLRAFAGYQLAVELRHRSWSDATGATEDLLREHRAAWVQIDEPKFRFSIAQNYLPNIRGFYYMRLHGRNAKEWWSHKTSDDRYNYLYSADELKTFTRTVDAARHIVKKAYLYTNNHFSAKAVANAAMIKAQLGEPIEGEYTQPFVERYPELTGIVRTEKKLRIGN